MSESKPIPKSTDVALATGVLLGILLRELESKGVLDAPKMIEDFRRSQISMAKQDVLAGVAEAMDVIIDLCALDR